MMMKIPSRRPVYCGLLLALFSKFEHSNAFIRKYVSAGQRMWILRQTKHADGINRPFGDASLSRSAFLTSLVAVPVVAYAASANITAQNSKTVEESISGFVAGAALTCTKTAFKYPLDTATVRLQMPNSDYSIFQLARLFDGSYRGIAAPLLANIPAGAVFFAFKDATKQSLSESDFPRWAKTCAAVAVAQFPYWAIRNPSEVVKTRQQAKIEGYGEHVGALDAYKKVREDALVSNNSTTGLEGFYSGYWENILYAYPADVIKFVCYDLLSKGSKNLSPAEGAVAGAASTAIAQLLTTPLDVVRNRVMAIKKKEGEEPSSYVESLVQLAKQEGVTGLYAGAAPRIGKAVLSGAIQFATYEETKQDIAKLFFEKKQ